MGFRRASVLEASRSTVKDKVNNKETDIVKLIGNHVGRKQKWRSNLAEEFVTY